MGYHPKQGIYREAEALGLPTSVMGESSLELTGDRQLLIHGKKGIRNYSETEVVVELRTCAVSVTGKKLRIAMMTAQEVMIRGIIDALQFLR